VSLQRWKTWVEILIIASIVFSQVAKWLGSKVGKVVGDWQKAKQKRIALTTSMIDYIKNIKMVRAALSDFARY
jgi:ATP-binding cassette subfamily C (CFTR/MRP) protein 1